ncbi:MAG: hypothetical protein LUF92_07485 [Clostridiales bacterium]|nr:hypothetical protein [Clostridiales bacterium]
MKMNYRKILGSVALCVLALCMLTGCKASKKKVLSSTYYQELQQENEELEEEIERLKQEAEEEEGPSVDETRAADYLGKIARDTLVKLEVGYADNMEGSEFVEDEAAFSIATAIAARADLTTKYTPEEIEEKYGPGYEYILYDEDNAIYEIYVYEGDYVVFTDLPNNVYYAYNASALGEAFLHYTDGYPDSSLLHRLADAPLITDEDENCYENDTAVAAANLILKMDKTKSSKSKAEKYWQKHAKKKNLTTYEPDTVVYTFYHHGNTLILTIYDKFYSIENMNGNKTWYKATKADVKQLKAIFTDTVSEADAETESDGDSTTESESDSTTSHSSEILEESDPTASDENE